MPVRWVPWDELRDGEKYAVGRFLRFQNIGLYDISGGSYSSYKCIDSIELVFVPDAAKSTFGAIFTSSTVGVLGTSSYGTYADTDPPYPSGSGNYLSVLGSTYDLRPFTSSFHDGSGTAAYSASSNFVRQINPGSEDYVRIKTAGLAASTDSISLEPQSIGLSSWFGVHSVIAECDKFYVTNAPSGYDAIMLVNVFGSSGANHGYYDDGSASTLAQRLDWNNHPLTLNMSGGPYSTSDPGWWIKPQVYVRVRFNAFAYDYVSGSTTTTTNTDSKMPFTDGDTVYLERIWN